MTYKIGIFTDIHANNYALNAILEDAKLEDLDEMVHLGDAIALGPEPKETLQNLIGHHVTMIKGNHEGYYLSKGEKLPDYIYPGEWEHQKWTYDKIGDAYIDMIDKLPNRLVKEINGFKFVMMHYSFEQLEDAYKLKPLEQDLTSETVDLFFSEKADVVFFGHDHKMMDVTSSISNTRYIDPGSAGCSNDNLARYVILEISENEFKIRFKAVAYDKSKLLESFIANDVSSGAFIMKFFHNLYV